VKLAISSVLLGLAWFGAINIAVSMVAWAIAKTVMARGGTTAASMLAIRFLPAFASLLFVLAIFLPVHWRFEQPETQESFGFVLGGLAAVGAGILMHSTWRALHTVWRGRLLLRAARRASMRLDDGILAVRGLPGISLAGIVRPRVLVGSEALDALTAAELDVAIAHEIAHRRSGDNLKRFLMFCAPDVFGALAIARRVEERWEADAECQADARAVDGEPSRAIVLASALIKVAKLQLRGPALVPPPAWSAFHVPTLLEMRVRRLVAGDAAPPVSIARVWTRIALGGVMAPVLVWLADLAYPLHVVTEAMVTRLP
jgi:hypothetical protein